ncbi:hypothetical protein Tsubulata_026814 [Turnera subulata]|uniref:C2 domain-containing protein n=1 Tax=Turnera subulata TaxID=218843 RepID=A0A9Q0F4C9_9ROSI|nr:hypothetical protein Tsubulata_026814 [Turnera subulata]
MVSASPSGRYRVLQVELRSADLVTKKLDEPYYVTLWIQPDRKLQSEVRRSSSGSKAAACCVWEGQKFVFSIPENFCRDDKSSPALHFNIHRARKYFRNSLVGSAQCDLKSLFADAVAQVEEQKKIESEEKGPVYDDDRRGTEGEDLLKDPRYDNMYQEDNVNKDDDDDVTDEGNPDGEVIQEPELRASATLQVSKGPEAKGTLSLDGIVWKNYINSNAKWRNVAMAYDEFMLNKVVQAKDKRKIPHCLCFAGDLPQEEERER